jgi:hypothetical protein
VPNDSSVPNDSQPTSQAENPDGDKEEITKQAPPKQQLLGSDGRPNGQKTSKQKQTEDAVLEKVLKAQEELLKIVKNRSDSVKYAMQDALDEHIIAMDLSGMDEESKQYWQKKSNLRLPRIAAIELVSFFSL